VLTYLRAWLRRADYSWVSLILPRFRGTPDDAAATAS